MFPASLLTARSLLAACRSPTCHSTNPLVMFTRTRTQLAPKKMVNIKRHKGRIPIPVGGSTKGTTLAFGEWGIRIKGNGVRFSAKQLLAAEEVLKRKMKVVKGAKVYLRVFTDIPVCIKGSETRMGKGKGSFDFWATRVPTGRVIFEIGGAPIREELARDALRQAADKLPTTYEFISRSSPPRLGRLLLPTTPSEPVKNLLLPTTPSEPVKNLLLPSAPSEPASTPSI